MITLSESGSNFQVNVQRRAEVEDQLNTAVALARARKQPLERMGVLVTRHSPSVFTVALSEDVPNGITLERDMSP